MCQFDYDIAVLGGGPGGYVAAIRGAQLGKKVALVEARELGGTCLNRGCIPTKALLHCAEVFEQTENAAAFGINAADVAFDYEKMAAFKTATVDKLVSGIGGLEKAHGVKVINGFGRLTDNHHMTVALKDGEEASFSYDKLILATGSSPARPPIEGINGQNVVTSDDILSMTELPESFVIIGGGVIGIEFATLFATLGRPVTVIEMMPSILPGVDPDVVRTALRVLKKKKVAVINNAKVTKIEGGDTVTVTYELNGAEKTASGACCVVSVGRKAETRGLGLEEIGVEFNRNFIVIDDRCRTNIENIYAIGDITGKIQLAHVASAQGLIAAANAAGHDEIMDYSVVPSCIYTSPEIAFVGLSEEKAKAMGIEYKLGTFNVAGNGRAMVMGENLGLVKLISDMEGKLIGAQLMCPRATDMIAELAAVIKLGGSVKDVADTIHAHPTISESVMEAAHDWEGLCCHALPKRK
ncbi:MAG: dihydrolipoyl dehydrogenase [Clostridiales bacterium]|nr:dihydrolipoyl dehydrogenase [Clostridiales bacterium]